MELKYSLKVMLISAGAVLPLGQASGQQVFNTNVIVIGSECVGNDCVAAESFGFDTLRLKENNTRLNFLDTSTVSGFPSTDWTLVANDSTSGGRNVFFLRDVSANREILSVEAGAPNFSLYVEDTGDVGFGTNNPVVDIHAVDGDTPTVRLEQNGSFGWTPQIWDVAGNETNFFVRDVTNGSKLPFRIRPNAPTNSIHVAATGDVGLGTASPGAKLHATGGDGTIRISNNETNSASKSGFLVTSHYTNTEEEVLGMAMFGNQNVNFVAIGGGSSAYNAAGVVAFYTAPDTVTTSGIERARFTQAGGFAVARDSVAAGSIIHVGTDATNGNGANLTNAGVWTNGSSRANKINIAALNSEAALSAVRQLRPVTYNGKQDDSETYVGFIAEDVPALVAMNDRKGIAAIEISAIVAKVVQDQQDTIEAQALTIESMETRLAKLEAMVAKILPAR